MKVCHTGGDVKKRIQVSCGCGSESNQSRLLDLLKRLVQEGITVLAVLHDSNVAFTYGDTFVFMKQGRIKRPRPAEAPWDAAFLADLFDTRIETVPYNGTALGITR